MNKMKLIDLVILRTALKRLIEAYSETPINCDTEEETLEKLNDLIRNYKEWQK